MAVFEDEDLQLTDHDHVGEQKIHFPKMIDGKLRPLGLRVVQTIMSDSVIVRTDFGGSAEIGYLRDRIPPGTGSRGTGFASQTPRSYGEDAVRACLRHAYTSTAAFGHWGTR